MTMAEPEELILEGAHFATRVARDVWRRYGTPVPDTTVPLASVRVRLEMFLSALFRTPVPVVRMEPPAPASWLSRLARGPAHHRGDELLLSGTDGRHVCLPPVLPLTAGGQDALSLYRLLAVEQAARLVRRTPQVFAGIESPGIEDWFLLAEAAAIDRWIAAEVPGLVPALAAARAHALGRHVASSHVHAGRYARTRGPRASCRRSPDATVPPGPRRLGRGLARLGAAAIAARCRARGIGGCPSVVLGPGACRSRSRSGFSRSRQPRTVRRRVRPGSRACRRCAAGRARGKRPRTKMTTARAPGYSRRRAAGERRGSVRSAAARRS